MSIDSKYYPQLKATDDDTVYTFEFESIGEEALQVFIIDEFGNRIELPRPTFVEDLS